MIFETSDGVMLHYELDGQGAPLVMLNGLWGDTSSWNAQVPVFKDHFNCIRIDQRGIGRSQKWVGDYSYALHARDVKELLDHLGIKQSILIGTCHGGMTASTFAHCYPDRVSAVCINGTQVVKSPRQAQIFIGWKAILQTADFASLYKSILPVIMSENWFAKNADNIEAMLTATEARIERQSALGLIQACIDFGFSQAEIAALKVPALLMASNEDRFASSRSIEAESKLWPGARYHQFSDCGHFPQREVPEIYNAVVLEYLQGFK